MSAPLPNDPLAIARDLRRLLDRIDMTAMTRTNVIYSNAQRRILVMISDLLEVIGTSGVTVPSEALQLVKQTTLLQQIEQTLISAGVQIEPALVGARQQAVQAAIDAGVEMAKAQGRDLSQVVEISKRWTTLDEEAVEQISTRLADGSPLSKLLDKLAVDTRIAVTNSIERAVVEHVNVDELAKELANTTDLSHKRALMITREATFSAQRAAADQVYQANSHLLKGKLRHERLDGKTCSSCVAAHSTLYPIGAAVPTHVNCRMVLVPVTSNGRGIQSVQSGEDWLRGQSDDAQLKTFHGNQTAYQAWKSGDVALEDFVAYRETPYGVQTAITGVDRAKAKASRRRGPERLAAD